SGCKSRATKRCGRGDLGDLAQRLGQLNSLLALPGWREANILSSIVVCLHAIQPRGVAWHGIKPASPHRQKRAEAACALGVAGRQVRLLRARASQTCLPLLAEISVR